MAMEDEWYWQDELFGANPESGSWQDIAQSLLNPVYDPEGRLLSRVLKDEPLSMAEMGENLQKDPMADPESNPVVRDREKKKQIKNHLVHQVTQFLLLQSYQCLHILCQIKK